MGVDPAIESISLRNPQTWNRYTYVLNNPLILIDPTGETLTVAPQDGVTKDKLVATANSGLHGKEVHVEDAGSVSLQSNGVEGPATAEQAAFEQTLTEAIEHPLNTSITLTDGSGGATIGNGLTGEVDMGDIQALGSGPGVNSVAALGHEISEQAAIQQGGMSQELAHDAMAVPTSNAIRGYPGIQRRHTLQTNTDGTSSGSVWFDFMKGGRSFSNVIDVIHNNVVNVTRR